MANSKITDLTELASVARSDMVEVVDDPGGTPVSKKAQPKNLPTVASATTALTNHDPNNTTMEQWGTEEAVVAQADAPPAAVVLAWLSGSVGPTASGNDGDRGEYRLEVSFDGGSSFATIGDSGNVVTLVSTAAGDRTALSAVGRGTGTVTGDIQVRAMIRDIDAANDTNWADGIITVLVHPQ
jgi:hypothetical protein